MSAAAYSHHEPGGTDVDYNQFQIYLNVILLAKYIFVLNFVTGELFVLCGLN
jgi:hypothetical protein